MDETGGHYAKWNKPGWERQMTNAKSYHSIWNVKKNLLNS